MQTIYMNSTETPSFKSLIMAALLDITSQRDELELIIKDAINSTDGGSDNKENIALLSHINDTISCILCVMDRYKESTSSFSAEDDNELIAMYVALRNVKGSRVLKAIQDHVAFNMRQRGLTHGEWVFN